MPKLKSKQLLTLYGGLFIFVGLAITLGSLLTKSYYVYGLILLGAFVLFGALLLSVPFLVKEGPLPIDSTSKKKNKIKTYFASKENTERFIYRTTAILYNILFIARFLMGHDYVENVSALSSTFMNKFEVGSGAILACYEVMCVLFLVSHEFFPTKRTDVVIKYLVSPVQILIVIFFPNVLRALVGDISAEAFSIRGLLLCLELALGLVFSLKTWLNNPSLKIDKEERYSLIVAIIIFLIVSINDYLPKNLFGEAIANVPTAKSFTWTHRIFIYLTFLLPVLYYKLLFPFDYGERRYFLFIIASGTLFAYAAIRRYETWTSIPSLPLHLCNTAMYIMPLTLAFKNYGLFYFTMFVNVIGAFFALLMPNFSDTLLIFGNQTFEFFINHMYATFMPVLIILLNIYERPKIKYFTYSMIGFLFYFILVSGIDIYYQGQGVTGVDFFFLSTDYIADKLGAWAENIYEASPIIFNFEGHTYTIRLIYYIAFFFTYVLLSLFMWFVYEVLFSVIDEQIAVMNKANDRKKKKELFHKEQEHPVSLVASHVSKTYPGNNKPSLIDFSLSLLPGKVYGFLGNNGAGKSTFIKACVGIHSFNEGSIKICGYDVVYETEEAKKRMAYVPDHYALEESLTGREYINHLANLYSVPCSREEDLLNKYLPLLHLQEAFDSLLLTYSHGMKQKITLLGALIHEPDIIILDEPLTGVDPESVYEIKKILLSLAKEGKIVFFSSHMIDVVESICDEVIIIEDGQFVDELDMKALLKSRSSVEETLLKKMNSLPKETSLSRKLA
jgi:ABC-2 type transport system ATP-binding protein